MQTLEYAVPTKPERWLRRWHWGVFYLIGTLLGLPWLTWILFDTKLRGVEIYARTGVFAYMIWHGIQCELIARSGPRFRALWSFVAGLLSISVPFLLVYGLAWLSGVRPIR